MVGVVSPEAESHMPAASLGQPLGFAVVWPTPSTTLPTRRLWLPAASSLEARALTGPTSWVATVCGVTTCAASAATWPGVIASSQTATSSMRLVE